jgi:hypothetical protein
LINYATTKGTILKCSPSPPPTPSKKNLKVIVACLPNCEKEIRKVFFCILHDYCNRFSVECTEKKITVNICFVEYNEEIGDAGVTINAEEYNKIHVQLRDPFLNGWEDNPYTLGTFVNVLCHEIIHACQHLTGRKGFTIPKLKYNKEDQSEMYYFDPYEIEARCLADFYATKYGNTLI